MSLISSTSSVQRIFKNQYVYPDWFTRKKYKFYERMLERLEKLSYIHTNSADHYSKMNIRIFGPSISITAFSSIASFLSTADFVDTGLKNGFAVTVGVMASVSTMLQSLASALQYGAKVEAHSTAAEEYNKLIIRLKFEMEMPDEEDFVKKLEKDIIDIQNKCNYFPPQFIVSQYDKMVYDRKLNKLRNARVDNMIDDARDGDVTSQQEASINNQVSIAIDSSNQDNANNESTS